MNRRIQELATQVGISVDYLTNTKQIELIEKFAELIVKECAHVALMSNGNNLHVCELIKKHFGVEE